MPADNTLATVVEDVATNEVDNPGMLFPDFGKTTAKAHLS
jgi:hypothetical protein